jgi:hypothetical protein
MKKGFELYIQEGIPQADTLICERYLKEFIIKTLGDPDMRYFGVVGGGYNSGLWRGRYGEEINWRKTGDSPSKTMVFRRISRNKRKFACVYADELVVKNDKLLDKSHQDWREVVPDGPIPSMNCGCPRHKPSLRVGWANGVPVFKLFAKIGESKG